MSSLEDKCYYLVIMNKKVNWVISSEFNFRDVTGGVYKAQVHIHRNVLIYDY